MAADHAKRLTAAREKLVAERRKLGSEIATGKTAAQYQERFIALQNTIEAIDRAIKEERSDLSDVVAGMSDADRQL